VFSVVSEALAVLAFFRANCALERGKQKERRR
jgi:hypothetical protein